jgi:hypothetical protein
LVSHLASRQWRPIPPPLRPRVQVTARADAFAPVRNIGGGGDPVKLEVTLLLLSHHCLGGHVLPRTAASVSPSTFSNESTFAVKWVVQNYLRPMDVVVLLHVCPTFVLYDANWGSILVSVDDVLTTDKPEEAR